MIGRDSVITNYLKIPLMGQAIFLSGGHQNKAGFYQIVTVQPISGTITLRIVSGIQQSNRISYRLIHQSHR
jgi:hypothetical protein